MRRSRLDALKTLYHRLPARLRGAVPARLELWLRDRYAAAAGLAGPTGPVRRLEDRLWGGFSGFARPRLAALIADPATPPRTAASAALALARWHGAEGEFEAALGRVEEVRRRDPGRARTPEQFMREAGLLCRLGRAVEARALLADRLAGADAAIKASVSASLMRANGWNPAAGAPEPRREAEARVLAEVNAMFARAGLAPVEKRDPAAPLGLDNLRGPEGLPARGGPTVTVTVIVPLFDAAATVETALRSLAAQTHAALEVLVVDDASADDGPDRVAAFAAADPRVRLIRQGVNAGAYAARNRGLAAATGDFVTVHDADDWSHPEKIARHLDDLTRRDAPFNISAWVRTTPELVFLGGWRPAVQLAERNFSSVFMPRALADRLGPWDTARLSADREFVNRALRAFGLPRQDPIAAGAPLAFGRSAAGSLTRTGPTHVATMYHGLRREYFEATDFWHAGLDPARLRAQGPGATPPYFPAPLTLRAERRARAHDLLFIGDFNFLGGTQKSGLAMIAAARAAGLDVALLQYRRVDQDVMRPLHPAVRAMAWENDVRIVAPGERLRAATVVVTYPPIFDAALDRFPEVEHDRLAVVVNQMAERTLEGADVAYDPARVRGHLGALLGSEGRWIPISARVRALMATDARYPRPDPDTWTPLLDTDRWCARDPVWRAAGAARPAIGRHGRDHPLKWPRDPASLRAAYCAGRPCDVHFLGGAVHARARLGAWPGNWRDAAFDARDVAGFLTGLDVFLHYPDPSYIEEFGRAPMEAMAVGVPVVLPPEFEPTFGAAALYAPPEGVWPLVARLWEDRGFWEARVAAGRAFVAAHCGYAVFPGRLARLAAADGDAAAPRAAAGP